MAFNDSDAPTMTSGDLSERVSRDVATLDGELAEIDMLVNQARVEAERHELKRAQMAEKLSSQPPGSPAEDTVALTSQLVTLTRRAAVMESQVEVLEGKRKVLARFREELAAIAEGMGSGAAGSGDGDARMSSGKAAGNGAGMSRIVLGAQEDLRREIARAMHDGPAQSLTNIVLQAQIVERLLAKDPEVARGEVRQLVSMVQQTLDATKSFIFDVRPMVLDDLGLVPTVRRAARERGRRAGVPVEFDSMGTDRRLSMDLESALFRIIDEAMAGYLSIAPDRVAVRLDWTDERVEAHVSASRNRSNEVEAAEEAVATQAARQPAGKDTPPALAAMMEERREQAEAAADAARTAAIVSLPPTTWREIEQRASTVGIEIALVGGGGEVQLGVDVPRDQPD
ncbi:MAG TPA: histidine kinase [Candidatus Limnocylindrales bacterium]|nr:histidine kinase [Candidatus Limnocylindrales bacterium]